VRAIGILAALFNLLILVILYPQNLSAGRPGKRFRFGPPLSIQDGRGLKHKKAATDDAVAAFFMLFAQRSWQTRPVARYRHRPDQGEDNPNRKGVAGNGRV
jgi:hypothetical protein